MNHATTHERNPGMPLAAAFGIACALSATAPALALEIVPSATAGKRLEHLTQGSDGKTPTLKNLTAGWVASLDERGEPITYTRENSNHFEYIGMPVGGIGAGLLYLGGDGKLWGWDLFNTKNMGHTRHEHQFKNPYARGDKENPAYHQLEQGFAVRIDQDGKSATRTLDRDGFKDIHFRGEYPLGKVSYADGGSPVKVVLEAFSPFSPLDVDASSYPATVLSYTITNTSGATVTGELVGWMRNAVCIESGKEKPEIVRHNRVDGGDEVSLIEFTAKAGGTAGDQPRRDDLVFDDFEDEKYTRWKVTGTAFGDGPMARDQLAAYLSNTNLKGRRGVISHNIRNGEDPGAADAHQGSMLSEEFTIERGKIAFLIGGGEHPGKTCLNLLVDGKVVRSATGKNGNELRPEVFDVSELQGQKARLEILDRMEGHWANIFIDHIVFCDDVPDGTEDWMKDRVDYGSMALALVESKELVKATADFTPADGVLDDKAAEAERSCADPAPVGALARSFNLKPGEQATVRFVLTWYFPNYRGAALATPTARDYGTRFPSARAVADEVVGKLDELTARTRLWHETWYDSSLPWWFLDRTFINTSILASSTCHLLEGGRLFGFEGDHLGYGTCTHVWGYVQAMGRLFPQLERGLREIVDYNPKVAFDANTGGIGQRGEMVRNPADDGQAGIILRTLLVHQMQPDKKILKGIYPQMKKAMDFLINQHDADKDGILTGAQMNTLDAEWHGKITWISLYYGAALRAAAEMAEDMNDTVAATEWRAIADRGRKFIESELYNGEFFIHLPDPEHPESPGTYKGCHLDQLLGQSWAYQLGLGAVVDPAKATKALDSIWRYNFTTDIGPYREKFTGGRWFALPGEGGFVMCSWPHAGDEALKIGEQYFAGYLNECMSGFEYAASSLMMWHGMPERSLAHTRILHERYQGAKRNPWNEVEWGGFYSRAMASYGVFTAACGFEYNGPAGTMAFAPKVKPERFKAAFTTAEGWGSFEQSRDVQQQTQNHRIDLKWGSLELKEISFELPARAVARKVAVEAGGKMPAYGFRQQGNRVTVTFAEKTLLSAGSRLNIAISCK
jgi:non-lysosomal glucosylceramidase